MYVYSCSFDFINCCVKWAIISVNKQRHRAEQTNWTLYSSASPNGCGSFCTNINEVRSTSKHCWPSRWLGSFRVTLLLASIAALPSLVPSCPLLPLSQNMLYVLSIFCMLYFLYILVFFKMKNGKYSMRCPRVLAHSHYFFPYYSFEPNIGCEKYPVKMGDMTAAATANEMAHYRSVYLQR